MNKIRVLGGILLLIGIVLMFKNDNSENSWMIDALIGIVVGAGFILIVFGKGNLKNKV